MTLPTLRPIPHAEERLRAVAIYEEVAELHDQRYTDCESIRNEMRAAVAPLREKFEQECNAICAPFEARIKEIEAKTEGRLADLDAESDAIEAKIGQGGRAHNSDYDRAFTCALTGCAVFEDDEYIEDEHSGDVILRDALPWPAETA